MDVIEVFDAKGKGKIIYGFDLPYYFAVKTAAHIKVFL